MLTISLGTHEFPAIFSIALVLRIPFSFWLSLLTYPCSEASGIFPGLWDSSQASEVQGSLEVGLSKWKVELLAALEVGASEVQSMILKVCLLLKVLHSP